ncbi:MAG: AlpA family phage regulatory protein [Pseudohongiella sp.]|nr:AlpA family phage regulatory protein [Pseudohongiella sp.]
MKLAIDSIESTKGKQLDQVRAELINPECTLIRIKDVSAMTGLARATLYKYMESDPTFPKAVPLSDSKARGAPIGFVLSEIQSWIRSRMAARAARG